MADNKKITEILEEVIAEMCDHYCKYPTISTPAGEKRVFTWCSLDSPCNDCPLNRL